MAQRTRWVRLLTLAGCSFLVCGVSGCGDDGASSGAGGAGGSSGSAGDAGSGNATTGGSSSGGSATGGSSNGGSSSGGTAAGGNGAGGSSGGAAGSAGNGGAAGSGTGGSGGTAGTGNAQSIESITCPGAMFSGQPNNFQGAAVDADPNASCARIQVDGEARYFIYELPDGYDANKAYPLVYGWHGCYDVAGGARYGYQLGQRANEAVIAVYPHSRTESAPGVPDGGNVCWGPPDAPSLAFFDELHAAMSGAFNVEQARVFTAGFSSGAVMSHLLGCKRAEVIDGVIGVSGIVPSGCTAPMPAFVFHGRMDPTVTFEPNFPNAITRYASTNGCSGAEPEFSPPNAPSPNAGPRVCVERSCDAGASLVYCTDNSTHDFGAWWWVMGYSLNRLLSGN